MTTTTALSLTRAARIGADLVDHWVEAGLPSPGSVTARIDYSVTRGHHERVTLMFYGHDVAFEALRKWASTLGTEVVEESDEVNDFIDAELEYRSVVVRLCANRPHVEREAQA